MNPAPVSDPERGPSGGTPPSEGASLIQRAQSGDLAAFDQLVLLHQRQVFAVALRMLSDPGEAEEVAQDTFVRAFRKIGSFRGEAKLSTWLVAITMNLCRNRRRWWARRRERIVASLDDPLETGEGTVGQTVADSTEGPDQTAASNELQQIILTGLQQLDEPFRMVIILRDLEDYSYEEIAEVLSCQIGTVKSRLSRARLQLRAILDGRL